MVTEVADKANRRIHQETKQDVSRRLNIRREAVMSRLMMVIALLVGVSACHAGFGIGDNGQSPTYVAANAWESAVAQASIGTVVQAAY